MRAVRSVGVAAVALVLSTGARVTLAQEAPVAASQVVARQEVPQRRKVSMEQAVRRAQRRFRARVVRAETETQGDRTIYVLRMLDDAGRVFAVRVDAASGAFL